MQSYAWRQLETKGVPLLSVLGAIVKVTRSQVSDVCAGTTAASLSDTLEPTHVVFVVACVARNTAGAAERPACVVAVCTLKPIPAPGLAGKELSQSKKRH